MVTMMVTMDRAGRVVIPKDARERLALAPDAELELTVRGDTIELAPVRRAGRVVSVVDGFPRIEAAPGIAVTDADVQGWRDADQR